MPLPSGLPQGARPPTLLPGLNKDNTLFALEYLEGLDCGCVAALYRATPWDVSVMTLEARGPHCIFPGHLEGAILRLGNPSEFNYDDEE